LYVVKQWHQGILSGRTGGCIYCVERSPECLYTRRWHVVHPGQYHSPHNRRDLGKTCDSKWLSQSKDCEHSLNWATLLMTSGGDQGTALWEDIKNVMPDHCYWLKNNLVCTHTPCSRPSRSLGSPAWLNPSLGSANWHPVVTPFMHQGSGANMHCVSYAVPATVQLIDSCQKPTNIVAAPANSPAALLGWPTQHMAAGCTTRCLIWLPLILETSEGRSHASSHDSGCISLHPQQNRATLNPNISSAYAMSLANTRQFD